MSRIGIRPIQIKEGVNIEITPSRVTVSAGQNKLELAIPDGLVVKQEDDKIFVTRKSDTKDNKSMHGLFARLLRNILTGVEKGFTKELEFKGTGYRVSIDGSEFVLNMGYSHEIRFNIPEGITVTSKKNTIYVSGIDKNKVGNFAAIIREVRPPEVYKGKGIKYKEELIKRKAGKKASASA